MHLSHERLIEDLKIATKKVRVGANYFHYKNPDQVYKVLRLAVTEEDDSICVIYQAQYGERLIFVRPLNSWLDTVDFKDKITDRFTQIK
jgi:hypothetical protein